MKIEATIYIPGRGVCESLSRSCSLLSTLSFFGRRSGGHCIIFSFPSTHCIPLSGYLNLCSGRLPTNPVAISHFLRAVDEEKRCQLSPTSTVERWPHYAITKYHFILTNTSHFYPTCHSLTKSFCRCFRKVVRAKSGQGDAWAASVRRATACPERSGYAAAQCPQNTERPIAW